jgi:hypothetical protein
VQSSLASKAASSKVTANPGDFGNFGNSGNLVSCSFSPSTHQASPAASRWLKLTQNLFA